MKQSFTFKKRMAAGLAAVILLALLPLSASALAAEGGPHATGHPAVEAGQPGGPSSAPLKPLKETGTNPAETIAAPASSPLPNAPLTIGTATFTHHGVPLGEGTALSTNAQLTASFSFTATAAQLDNACVAVDLPTIIAVVAAPQQVDAVDASGTHYPSGSLTLTPESEVTLSLHLPEGDTSLPEDALFTLSFSLTCCFNTAQLPPADEADQRLVTLESDGQSLQIILTEPVPDVAAPPAPRAMSQPFTGVATITGNGLYKSNTQLENGNEVSINDTLVLKLSFTINSTQSACIASGVIYDLPLPGRLAWVGTNIVRPLKAGDETFGTLYINSGECYIIFEDSFWSSYDELDGFLDLTCKLNLAPEDIDESYPLTLPDGTTLSLVVTENKVVPVPTKITKSGVVGDSCIITWTVKLDWGNENAPLTLVDSLDSKQHFIENTFKIDSVVIASGVVIDHGSNPPTLTYTFPSKPQQGSSVTITYQTTLADEEFKLSAATSASNTAKLYKGDDYTGISKTATVAVAAKDKLFISKNGGAISVDDRQMEWTVTITTNDRRLDNLKLYDKIPTGMSLVPSSVRYISSSNSTSTPLPEQAGASAPAWKEFYVTIPKNGSGYYDATYTVTYKTQIADQYFDEATAGVKLTNKARLEFTWSKHEGGGEVPHTSPEANKEISVNTSILKKSGSYNPASHTIRWTVQVNVNKVHISSGTITDTLPSGLTYVANSFTSTHAALTEDGGNAPSLGSITFHVGELNGVTASFSFDTVVDNSDYYAYNLAAPVPFVNTASFSGSVVGASVNPVTHSASATTKVTSKVLEKAASGYDARTNIIRWTVTVNQNKMPMAGTTLVDVLPPGFAYSEGSLKVNNAPHSDMAYDSSTRKLTVRLGTLVENTPAKVVTFSTIISPDQIAAFKTNTSFGLSNSVTLEREGCRAETATGSQPINNKVLEKKGTEGGNHSLISYVVNINPNKIDLTGLTLTDTPSDGLWVDMDSIRLYRVNVDVNGNFPANPALGTLITPHSLAKRDNGFALAMPSGRHAYQLVYDCTIIDYSIQPLTNTIAFSSGITGEAEKSDTGVHVPPAGGGGSVNPNKAKLEIIKKDSVSGAPIGGVVFKLYEDGQYFATGTTDAAGKLIFYPLGKNKAYTLEEVQPASGYNCDPHVEGQPLGSLSLKIGVNLLAGKTKALTVTNSPIGRNLTLLKTNHQGAPLEGVVFTLKRTGLPAFSQQATSLQNGHVIFTGVSTGSYTLEETSLPAALQPYVTSPTPLPDSSHTVEVTASGTITLKKSGTPVPSKTIVNTMEEQELTLTRYVAGTNQPLAGVGYTVYCNGLPLLLDPAQLVTASDGTLSLRLARGLTYRISENTPQEYEPSPPVSVTTDGSATTLTLPWPKTLKAASNGNPPEGNQPASPPQAAPDGATPPATTTSRPRGSGTSSSSSGLASSTSSPMAPTPATASVEAAGSHALSEAPPSSLPSLPQPDPLSARMTKEETAEHLRASGVPIIRIGGAEVPLHIFTGAKASLAAWSLFNLIMTIIGALIGLIKALHLLMKNKNPEQGQGETSSPQVKQRSKALSLMALILSLAELILFVIICDFVGLMVIFDHWSLLFALTFIAQLVLLFLSRKKAPSAKDRQ